MAPTYHLDNGQIRLTFLKRAADTNGELLEMEAIYRPVSSAPPAHYHPSQEETFEVLSGALRVDIEGKIRDVVAGERIVIPRGAVHRMHNAGAEEARVIWQTRPALRSEQFFEWLYGLAMEGKANAQGVPNILHIAMIMREHAAEFVLARPSRPFQRVVFGVLAPIGRAVGYGGGRR